MTIQLLKLIEKLKFIETLPSISTSINRIRKQILVAVESPISSSSELRPLDLRNHLNYYITEFVSKVYKKMATETSQYKRFPLTT
jgi:hypothetical protein